MSKTSATKLRDRSSSSGSSRARESNENKEMDDPERSQSRVAQIIEQLHTKKSSPPEKELITARLLGMVKSRKEVRVLIGSNGQAMPLLISILRTGTLVAKINVASTLSILCRDEDLRVKVLIGGCVPPLLSMLKSESIEARKAASEAISAVSSGGLSDDHVGMKIFVTEGVVPTLWEHLNPKSKQDRVVEAFITGALRNLCGDKDGYWATTLEAGGVAIIVGLLSSDNYAAQSNAASLLARLILTFADSIPKIIESGAINALLRLIEDQKDVSVCASASDALEALSSKSTEARKCIVDAQGVQILIGAIVAPSKEGMQGEGGQELQRHATQALANIRGGMSSLILYLGELSQSPRLAAPVPDILGALSYTLMVFEQSSEEEIFDALVIENILVTLLKPRDNKLIQERILEGMASLYSNAYLSRIINQSEAKKVLVGLVTLSSGDAQEYLILALIQLCCDGVSVWEAIGKREGIQLLISFLGLSCEHHQEFAVQLLAILTDQVDDSKWAITAAGGIPPLVHLLEIGSQMAKEYGAYILWNLCSHSEEIRACVESAGAIPVLLWLLKNGGPKGQEASAKALAKLITIADSATIKQLLDLLLGNSPRSKDHIIKVLGHVLSVASHSDLVQSGATANKGLKSLVRVLDSSDEKTREYAASILADLFRTRHDICDSLATDDVFNSCMRLLTGNNNKAAKNKSYMVGGDVKPLIKLAKTSSIDSAETAMATLAKLLMDPRIAAEALEEDVISALTRVLGEGSIEGKKQASRALNQLLRHFPIGDIFSNSSQCRFSLLSILEALNAMDMKGNDAGDALDVISQLARTKQGVNTYSLWSALAEVPSSLGALVNCLCKGPPQVQDKAIEILSRLCGDQAVVLGDALVSRSRSIGVLANRIVNSTSLEVRVGGAAMLVSAAKEHQLKSMDVLHKSGYLKPLIYSLVEMMRRNSMYSSLEIEVRTARGFVDKTLAFPKGNDIEVPDPATVLGGTVALWLLSIISSYHAKNKLIVVEAGGLEALSDKLVAHTSNRLAEFEDAEGIWIVALLLAILFQDDSVVSSPAAVEFISSLAILLNSDELIDKFFAAQAMASLVSHKKREINLAIANSGAVSGLVTLIGFIEFDMPNLISLCKAFSLVSKPDQVVLDYLFEIEDVRNGSTAHKTIPLLVDLLRPMPERPGAPPVAVRLLTRIADGNDANKLTMVEAGVLDGLSKYLSLSPQDLTEATISELLRILFSCSDVIEYEETISCAHQLIAVLHLGSRSARLSAAKALDELFYAEKIRDSEASMQAVQPLVDMLSSTSTTEQHVALSALIKLTWENNSNAALMAEAEGNSLGSLQKLISSSSSLEFKSKVAKLCYVLFGNSKVRTTAVAFEFVEPFILLMQSGSEKAMESGVCALEKLLDDEQHVEVASTCDIVELLAHLVSGKNHRLIEASIGVLIKIGKDRTPCKLDMVKAGIIDNCLELLPSAPISLCSKIAELFRILTNSSAISKSSAAARVVEPLFMLLLRSDFSLMGQHSALQALVNILEKPQSLATLKLTPSQIIEPLIKFLESSSEAMQQLGTELLSHLLEQEHFKQDITTKNAIVPLVQLAGIGILNLQQTAIKALESISLSWPEAVADAGGIFELAKVIIQDDPEPDDEILESAALVLCNLLRFNADYYFKVPQVVLVKMLHSMHESTFTTALNALIVQEQTDAASGELMVEAGALDALLDLLRSHQCEEESGRLLEALFNNVRIREMKISKYAIAPLAQYLLDPQTQSESGKLLATLALGDLSQHEGLSRSSDSVFACRALISLLEDQPTEGLTTIAICALQNYVMRSRTNRRAVAEAGGVLVIQELLLSSNPEIVAQAAMLIKFLFSNHTLQEYVSNELIRSLTAALEKELLSSATINEEVLRTIHVIFANFPKIHVSEAATVCIPHLIAALKSENEAALNTLCVLRHSWTTMPIDVSKSQTMAAAEAIPVLQRLMKICPPSFHERADYLLHSLPGCLTVTIIRANNLKPATGGTNAFCQLNMGNGPARQTKVVSHNTSPEWKEGFTWAFDAPPNGQKLHIVCRNKSTFGKTSLGRVTIQIDKVVSEGTHIGEFNLSHDTNKDSSPRTLEVEITWSNRTSEEP